MYDPTVTDLTGDEHEFASALFDLISAVRHEYSYDEDPGKIDLDDLVTLITKAPGPVMTLFRHFTQDNVALAKDLEAAVHGVVRNLKVLDDSDAPA